jgi:co-chaperonin GroES (HSP10)
MIPLGHRVLVKKAKLEERDPAFAKARAAGIVLAPHEDSKRREAGVDRGWVVAVGPDAFKAFHLNAHGTLDGFVPWVKEGDYIAFAKYGGMVIQDPNTEFEYICMNDEDVVLRLEELKNE